MNKRGHESGNKVHGQGHYNGDSSTSRVGHRTPKTATTQHPYTLTKKWWFRWHRAVIKSYRIRVQQTVSLCRLNLNWNRIRLMVGQKTEWWNLQHKWRKLLRWPLTRDTGIFRSLEICIVYCLYTALLIIVNNIIFIYRVSHIKWIFTVHILCFFLLLEETENIGNMIIILQRHLYFGHSVYIALKQYFNLNKFFFSLVRLFCQTF